MPKKTSEKSAQTVAKTPVKSTSATEKSAKTATKTAPASSAAPKSTAKTSQKSAPVAKKDVKTETKTPTPKPEIKGKFVIKRTADGRYMFNMYAGNMQIIAASQIYSSLAACRGGIESVGTNAPIAAIEDNTLATINKESFPKFQIYLDKGGKYRFNLWAANGQNILACTQGYTQKSACKNGLASVVTNAHGSVEREEDQKLI